MKQKRRRYSEQFKRDVIKHLEETGKTLTQLSREMEIPLNNLSAWKKKFGSNAEPSAQDQMLVDYERLKKLEQQTRELQEENEILKKAMHFFTKNQN